MMASVDAEADMENLFAGDDVHQDGGMDATQTLTQEEGQLSLGKVSEIFSYFQSSKELKEGLISTWLEQGRLRKEL